MTVWIVFVCHDFDSVWASKEKAEARLAEIRREYKDENVGSVEDHEVEE